MIDLLKQVTDKKVVRVLDPTLLVDKEVYDKQKLKLNSKEKITYMYIL